MAKDIQPMHSSAMQGASEERSEPYKQYGERVPELATPQRAESTGKVASPARQQAGTVHGLEPSIIVVFGITGDLAQRKLLPALYHLLKDNLLHPHTQIVGVSRRDISTEQLLNKTELCVLEADKVCDSGALKKFGERFSMFKMDLANGEDYDGLLKHLNDIETKHGMCMNRLYYLSVPPGASGPLVTNLGEHGLNGSCPHGTAATRLLVEKPFGYDLPSARELIAETSKYFKEAQIFRIDHYLAKETVQNILTFRFHNPIFEAIWDAKHIERIDVVASETIGIEGRATFYEQTGALRDLIQSHLLQLLAAATMERPSDMTSDAVHATRLKLLEAIEPVLAAKLDERAIRGQYDGYRQEVNNADSYVETFAALTLFIDSPRWQSVPMHITTGKALDEKITGVNVTFKQRDGDTHTNVLTFSVQPNEGIGINLCVKRPGFDDQIQSAIMDFSYQRAFDDGGHPDAYERVLVDATKGDRTLFATSAEVLASWHILQPILEAWTKNGDGLKLYKPGSAGIKANN